MARKTLTIVELRRRLAASEKQLKKLLADRGKLAARLAGLDAVILALGGEVPAPTRAKRRKKAPKVAAKGAAKVGKKTRKRAGAKPLGDYIAVVLKKQPGGMRINAIAPAAIKAGYVTKSKDFYGIVAAALREDARFKKVSRGVYVLA